MTTRIYVVRHAKAGSRRAWSGPDAKRPLSRAGLRQAAALSAALRAQGLSPQRLISSPARRCVQTLQPVAHDLGIELDRDGRLAEGRGAGIVAYLRGLDGGGAIAVCTHGDVIEALLGEVGTGNAGRPPQSEKAGMWILDIASTITPIGYCPPPVDTDGEE